MEVTFASRHLARCYENSRTAEREWGRDVARRYRDRIDRMIAASNLSDLFAIQPLRLHPLGHDRAGQYAMTLIGGWRLIIAASDDMRSALVKEVTMHYGD